MSSSERVRPYLTRRPLLAAFVLTAAGLTAVAGCTVRPLYSEAGYAGAGTTTGSIGAELSAIAVKPVYNRVGQEVRNHLIFLFNGGRSEPASPNYTLDLRVSDISEATTNIQVGDQNEPTSALLTAQASYTLTDTTGKVVARGSRQFMSAYDVPRQEFAALRARRDAENRASRELAELIRMAVAQDLAKARPSAQTAALAK